MPTAVFTPQGVHDPLASLARAFRRDGSWLAACVLLAAIAHCIGALTMPHTRRLSSRARDTPLEVIEIDVPPPSPVPLPTEPVPAAAQLKPAAAPKEAPRPTVQAAQAAQVLTRSEASNDPLDLTGGFVTGSAATYAGGTTMAAGTSHTVVHAVSVAASAAPPVAKQDTAVIGPDPSRRPSMVGGSLWQCPFPIEADGVDNASVDLMVDVDASGHVKSASIAKDPGHGFGREAQRCVLDKQWQPALNRAGTAIAGTAAVRVRFTR